MGLEIAQETTEALAEIISGVGNMATSMEDLAAYGQDNQKATLQVTQAMEQVSIVTQQNSATSEESAAASQEMHQYADSMQQLVKRFKLNTEPARDSQALPSASV